MTQMPEIDGLPKSTPEKDEVIEANGVRRFKYEEMRKMLALKWPAWAFYFGHESFFIFDFGFNRNLRSKHELVRYKLS